MSVSHGLLLFSSLSISPSHSQFPFLRPTKAKTEMARGGGRHGDGGQHGAAVGVGTEEGGEVEEVVAGLANSKI